MKETEWISVDDYLPENYEQPYLVIFKDGSWDNNIVTAWLFDTGEWVVCSPIDIDYYLHNVTDWMPLPKPPEGGRL